MQEELAELLHLVALPILHTTSELLNRFIQKITVHCLVSLGQDSLSSFATASQVCFNFVILALLVKILLHVSC